MKLQRLVRSDVSSIVLVGFITQGLTLISGPLVARMVGPDGRGQLVIIAVISIVSAHLATTSLSNAIAATVARHHAGARNAIGQDVRVWSFLAVLVSLAAGGITFLLLPHAHHILELAIDCAVITWTACRLNLTNGMLQAEHAVKQINVNRTTFTAVYVLGVLGLFLIYRTDNPGLVLLCQIVAQLCALGLATRALRPKTDEPTPHLRGEVLDMTKKSYLGALGTADLLGLDNLVIQNILGTMALGLWAVAGSATTLPTVATVALAPTLLARMSARPPREAAKLMRRWLLAGLAITLSVVFVLEVILGPALRILFGHAFVPATGAAQILAIGAGCAGMRFMLSAAVQAQGRAKQGSYVDFVVGNVLLATVATGAALHGLEGAAVGMLIAKVANCLLLLPLISWSGERSLRSPDQDHLDEVSREQTREE